MQPAPQSPLAAAAGTLFLSAALGILFVALFAAASSDPCHAVMRHPDAVLPLLLLTLNMSGLFACAVFASVFGGSGHEGGGGRYEPSGKPGAVRRACVLRASR